MNTAKSVLIGIGALLVVAILGLTQPIIKASRWVLGFVFDGLGEIQIMLLKGAVWYHDRFTKEK
jgi:hypothetical protein